MKRVRTVQSPSESTIYGPALNKLVDDNQSSTYVDKISQFVEGIHIQAGQNEVRGGTPDRNRQVRLRTLDLPQEPHDRTSSSEPPVAGPSIRTQDDWLRPAREVSDQMVLESEKYKTNQVASQGMVPIVDGNVELMRKLDTDDDFFHVTCHVEESLWAKICKGEYVELEHLIVKDKCVAGHAMRDEGVLELVTRDGHTFFAPARDRDNKISNIKRWDQAFRVYAAIYSEANPGRSAEIWQYIDVIHKAANSYAWDNVLYYDFTFRQLMAQKPWRSWAKTYTQAWNLALNQPLGGAQVGHTQGERNPSSDRSRDGKYGDWRDDCCWRFNRNKCLKGAECHFDH